MKKILSLILVSTLLVTGCGSITKSPETAARVNKVAKLASYIGTTEYLRAYPMSRPAFELAQLELERAAVSEGIDMAQLLAIVQRLPIKNIQNERASMYITSSVIILSEFGDKLPLERLTELQPVAKAIADGIALALQ